MVVAWGTSIFAAFWYRKMGLVTGRCCELLWRLSICGCHPRLLSITAVRLSWNQSEPVDVR